WLAHHLPHNVDRVLNLDGDVVERKRALLAHMDDDRDKNRRRDAFASLHAINAELARQHAPALERARLQVERARVGLANEATLAKRDWCFALYPEAALRALADQMRH